MQKLLQSILDEYIFTTAYDEASDEIALYILARLSILSNSLDENNHELVDVLFKRENKCIYHDIKNYFSEEMSFLLMVWLSKNYAWKCYDVRHKRGAR